MLNKMMLIGLGSGCGGVLRYIVSNNMYLWLGRHFPYGTLTVNAIGSFLIGFLFIVIFEYLNGMSDHLSALLLVGFLGGFTTFSAFSMETLLLLEKGDIARAFFNVVASVGICLFLTGLGMVLARQGFLAQS